MTTAPAREQHPQDVVRKLLGLSASSPVDAFRQVSTPSTEVEDFRPLGQCLEWRLADAYWAGAGAIPFVRNDVPYLVNNTGRLSENAAAVVFAAFEELRASLPDRLVVFELGAGTGLHARYFLDAFRAQCEGQGSDFYDRLTYVVSDRFERTVQGWKDDGLFAEHEEHVALRICDAMAPSNLALPGGGRAPPTGAPMVVFCNYILDVLPCRIVRRSTSGLEELCVRAHVASTSAMRAAGLASLDEARALAASGRLTDLTRLLPLLPELELETTFRPWTPSAGNEEVLASALPTGDRVIVNGDALNCLESLLGMLAPSGFVLVNDYGPTRAEDVGNHLGVQRFGGSVAMGLNFPLIERVLSERAVRSIAPEGDEQRRVRTRLIGRQLGERTLEAFRHRFRLEADRYLDTPLEEARAHLAAGRRNDALEAYRVVVERNPKDWQMVGEAAEFVGLQLGDHAAGLEIVRAALERNPWYSPWLWNILGDCFFYRERLDEAHQAFLQALRIDPDDPRTNLNLAYTLSARGEQGAALAVIARGLASDGRGMYRSRLLEKQAQVLSILSERAAAAQSRLARRAERFR